MNRRAGFKLVSTTDYGARVRLINSNPPTAVLFYQVIHPPCIQMLLLHVLPVTSIH